MRLIPRDDFFDNEQAASGPVVHDETGVSASGDVVSRFDERNLDLDVA